MNTSTNVVRLRQPEEFEDPLTDILRSGARRLLAQAVELEAEVFLARMQDLKLPATSAPPAPSRDRSGNTRTAGSCSRQGEPLPEYRER
jgi:hypothetical protein